MFATDDKFFLIYANASGLYSAVVFIGLEIENTEVENSKE